MLKLQGGEMGGGESSYSRGRLSSKLFSPPRRSFNQLNRTRFENCQKLSRSGGMQSKFLVIRRWDPAAFNGTAIHGANLFPIVTCSKTDRFCGPSVNDAHHHNFSLGKEERSPLPIERKQRVVLIVFPKGKRIKKNKKRDNANTRTEKEGNNRRNETKERGLYSAYLFLGGAWDSFDPAAQPTRLYRGYICCVYRADWICAVPGGRRCTEKIPREFRISLSGSFHASVHDCRLLTDVVLRHRSDRQAPTKVDPISDTKVHISFAEKQNRRSFKRPSSPYLFFSFSLLLSLLLRCQQQIPLGAEAINRPGDDGKITDDIHPQGIDNLISSFVLWVFSTYRRQ